MLTKREKVRFVRDLVSSLQARVLKAINDNRIPDNWDGFELRQYLADKFAESAYNLAPARKKEYRQEVLTRNL